MPTDKFVFRASVYGILMRDKKFLMVAERWAHKWEFPGGGVNVDETIEDALRREFLEETGYLVRVGKLLTVMEDFFWAEDRDEGWHSLRFIYEVSRLSGRLQIGGNNEDVERAAFMSKSDLTKKNTKPPIYALLQGL